MKSLNYSKIHWILIFTIFTFSNAFAQPYSDENDSIKAERLKWYKEARFGMFIHWGAYSVLDGEYKGMKQKGPLGEWIMQNLKIPIEDYRRDVVGQFNPKNFDAEKWVKSAYDAGMKYIVMTTKHHDGFALFNSSISDYNITAQSPFKRDVIKELSDACRKYGLKFGVYYSQAQDWYHPGGYLPKSRWDKKQEGDWNTYFKTIVKGQVTELLTNYGDISLIWWDSARTIQNDSLAIAIGKELVKLQPKVIVNPRLSLEAEKDFNTYEQVIPGILDYPYNELCITQNRSWSYKPSDTIWKSPDFILKTLIHMASLGGNFLFNVGPKPNGEFPVQSIEAINYIGDWMDINGESIYGTKANPFYKLPYGEATMKTNGNSQVIYLQVMKWPSNRELNVEGLNNNVAKVEILGSKSNPKIKNYSEGILIQNLPSNPVHPTSTVIKLTINEPLNINPGYLVPNIEGDFVLFADKALFTTRPQFDCIPEVKGTEEDSVITNWKNCIPSNRMINTGNASHWKIDAPNDGNYKVIIEYGTKMEGNVVTLKGAGNLKKTLPNTGDLNQFESFDLGTLKLKEGINTITLSGGSKDDLWDEVQIKRIILEKM